METSFPANEKPVYEVSKRASDIVASSFGLIVLSPLLICIAALIKSASPGPVFYRALRTGIRGESFRIFKFRSMVVGADEGAGTTSRNDRRITTVGRFLRRYKLDELPQLLNVLMGHMSLVGPRPELPRYTSRYREEEKMILTVKPGITDYASIQFSKLNDLIDDYNPDKEFEEKVLKEKNRLRVQYVKERGFLLDMRIICKTVLCLLGNQ